MRLLMSRLGKVALVLLVLTLLVVGLPVGMPMASCPQCVLPAGAMCLLVALLTAAAAVLAPVQTGGRMGVLALRLPAWLWARRVERPPQRRSEPA
jgi:hypothetical protein